MPILTILPFDLFYCGDNDCITYIVALLIYYFFIKRMWMGNIIIISISIIPTTEIWSIIFERG